MGRGNLGFLGNLTLIAHLRAKVDVGLRPECGMGREIQYLSWDSPL